MRKSKYPDKILSEVYPDIFDTELPGGIFLYMDSTPPWNEWDITSSTLDAWFFYNHSGDKLISPFLHKVLADDEQLNQLKMELVASYLSEVYYPKWAKLFATFDLEYNPIHNYSATKTIAETHTDTGTSSATKGTTDTRTYNVSDNRQIDRDVTETADRSAYNSSTYSPVDKVVTEDNTRDVNTKTGTDTLGRTGTDTGSESKSGGYNITETRGGSAGGYMYQDMIKKDRDLWIISYFDYVFSDIDKLLTLPIYPADEHRNIRWLPYGYPMI